MKIIRHKPARLSDDRMMPMINIVFLLLIFFMMMGRIDSSHELFVNLPNSFDQQEQKPHSEDIQRITLHHSGQLYIDHKTLEFKQVMTQVTKWNKTDKNLKLSINADALAENGDLNRLLKGLAEMQISSIRLDVLSHH